MFKKFRVVHNFFIPLLWLLSTMTLNLAFGNYYEQPNPQLQPRLELYQPPPEPTSPQHVIDDQPDNAYNNYDLEQKQQQLLLLQQQQAQQQQQLQQLQQLQQQQQLPEQEQERQIEQQQLQQLQELQIEQQVPQQQQQLLLQQQLQTHYNLQSQEEFQQQQQQQLQQQQLQLQQQQIRNQHQQQQQEQPQQQPCNPDQHQSRDNTSQYLQQPMQHYLPDAPQNDPQNKYQPQSYRGLDNTPQYLQQPMQDYLSDARQNHPQNKYQPQSYRGPDNTPQYLQQPMQDYLPDARQNHPQNKYQPQSYRGPHSTPQYLQQPMQDYLPDVRQNHPQNKYQPQSQSGPHNTPQYLQQPMQDYLPDARRNHPQNEYQPQSYRGDRLPDRDSCQVCCVEGELPCRRCCDRMPFIGETALTAPGEGVLEIRNLIKEKNISITEEDGKKKVHTIKSQYEFHEVDNGKRGGVGSADEQYLPDHWCADQYEFLREHCPKSKYTTIISRIDKTNENHVRKDNNGTNLYNSTPKVDNLQKDKSPENNDEPMSKGIGVTESPLNGTDDPDWLGKLVNSGFHSLKSGQVRSELVCKIQELLEEAKIYDEEIEYQGLSDNATTEYNLTTVKQ